MKTNTLQRFLPTLSIIHEELEMRGWTVTEYQEKAFCTEKGRVGGQKDSVPRQEAFSENAFVHQFKNVRLFNGQRFPEKEILYIVPENKIHEFPCDEFSYITNYEAEGLAAHLVCNYTSEADCLTMLMDIFDEFISIEQRMDELVLTQDSLHVLCNFGESYLGNALVIHDDWFIVIAMSDGMHHVMPPEHITSTNKYFIPRKFTDAFKFDQEYSLSSQRKGFGIWLSGHQPESKRSMYVNLWDGDLYRGRMVCVEYDCEFRNCHFLFAECLAQRAMLMMREINPSENWTYRSMDDFADALLKGIPLAKEDETLFMGILGWKYTDQYLCVQVRSQQEEQSTLMEHALHSDICQLFHYGYPVIQDHRLHIILNLTKEQLDEYSVRQKISELCRDNLLYAGISAVLG